MTLDPKCMNFDEIFSDNFIPDEKYNLESYPSNKDEVSSKIISESLDNFFGGVIKNIFIEACGKIKECVMNAIHETYAEAYARTGANNNQTEINNQNTISSSNLKSD